MNAETHQKVDASHLKRNAYLYIRQSTPRQILENTESTKRQYALRQRAVALGWSSEQIIVIDCDLGQSAAPSAADREGFERLVTEVGMGRAGIVLGLEVSRLARNSIDGHRLLEMCALTCPVILDEEGIYDPSQYNDRLLLGLKGAMSEAELHVIKSRMRGGVLNKASRGELAIPLPIGLVYDANGAVILDPDRQVQQSVHLLFATFRRTGSACATVRSFREQGLLFPRRPGPQHGGTPAPGAVAHTAAAGSSWLHRLGGARREPVPPARKRPGTGRRSGRGTAARGASAAAGISRLRDLWKPDGRSPPCSRPVSGSRISLRATKQRTSGAALAADTGHQRGRRDRATVSGDRHSRSPGSGSDGTSGDPVSRAGGRPPTQDAGRTCPL